MEEDRNDESIVELNEEFVTKDSQKNLRSSNVIATADRYG